MTIVFPPVFVWVGRAYGVAAFLYVCAATVGVSAHLVHLPFTAKRPQPANPNSFSPFPPRHLIPAPERATIAACMTLILPTLPTPNSLGVSVALSVSDDGHVSLKVAA